MKINAQLKQQHSRYHIVLADDSKMVRNQMNELLGKLGFKVTLFENGAEALKYLQKIKMQAEEENKSIKDYVSILLTDIEMPQMDGYTLTAKVKADPVLANIPVVMHTSLSGDNVKLRGKEVGADEYITKFSVAHIKETLEKVIKNSN